MWPFDRYRDDLARLEVLILFVTSRCNSRCAACFNWQRLNDETGVMTLAEIERLAATIPPFPHLVLSGGEPTLRDDTADIAAIFARCNAIAALDIPTNALLPERAAILVERILTENPALRLTLGLSLDGMPATHDALRGVPGGFDKVFETARRVNELRARHAAPADGDWERRLTLATCTTLSDRNEREYPSLIEYTLAHADVDLMEFEPIRDAKRDDGIGPPSPESCRELAKTTLELNDRLLSKRLAHERAKRLSYFHQVHEIQARYLETGQIPLPCMAGRRVAIVEHDAKLKLCESLEPVANLRDFSLDFRTAWNCDAAVAQRRWIRKTQCSCGHCLIVGRSIDDDPLMRSERETIEALHL